MRIRQVGFLVYIGVGAQGGTIDQYGIFAQYLPVEIGIAQLSGCGLSRDEIYLDTELLQDMGDRF